MELNLAKQTVTINETVYDGFVEQPIECDALLPDYCPDIVKVLKCMVTPVITSAAVSGDRLIIDGMVTARIYYSSDTPCIRQSEYKIPFSKTVELRSAPQNPIVTATPTVDYVNCRAVNQRRVDIRGALSISVKVVGQKEEQVISGCDGAGMQLRQDVVPTTRLEAKCVSSLSISEELELGYGKNDVGAVIRAGCEANVTDYKIIAGKVVIKGDLLVHVLYQTKDDENKLDVMDYSLPISQIVDCGSVDENSICMVDFVVVSCDLQPKTDANGEYRGFALDARLQAVVLAHRGENLPIASDCYSTLYETRSQSKPLSSNNLTEVVQENVMHKTTLELPENVADVVDVWCLLGAPTWKPGENALQLEVKCTVCMFARMEDGEMLYFEQESNCETELPTSNANQVQFDPTASNLSTSFSLSGKEQMDLRCEILIKGCLYEVRKIDALRSIEVDDQAVKTRDADKLYLYYADEGESVWNIAKHYNTSTNAIWEENAIEDDKLSTKCMLFIPIV